MLNHHHERLENDEKSILERSVQSSSSQGKGPLRGSAEEEGCGDYQKFKK